MITSNVIVVGWKEPSIEIWDLDIEKVVWQYKFLSSQIDEVQPCVLLGGFEERNKKGKKICSTFLVNFNPLMIMTWPQLMVAYLDFNLFVEIWYVVLFVRFVVFENLNAVKLEIIVDNSSFMAWSLIAIFSINSMASFGVSSLIFPPAEASRSCLDWGHRPSIKMLSWTGSLNPCVGVFRSNPWKRSSALLNDSLGCWRKDEISTLPFVVLDTRKYFFRNFSTTSSHVRRLFPLNEWSHLFASPAKEKENKLRQTTSSGTLTIFTVLQISMYVARCAYGSSLGSLWNRFP